MILHRIQQFLAGWRESSARMRLFLAWNAANTLLAFGLLGASFLLLTVMSRAGFQRTLLLSYIAVAVAWLLSIFAIGPAFDRVDPDEA